jgi:hypothetical protein
VHCAGFSSEDIGAVRMSRADSAVDAHRAVRLRRLEVLDTVRRRMDRLLPRDETFHRKRSATLRLDAMHPPYPGTVVERHLPGYCESESLIQRQISFGRGIQPAGVSCSVQFGQTVFQ